MPLESTVHQIFFVAYNEQLEDEDRFFSSSFQSLKLSIRCPQYQAEIHFNAVKFYTYVVLYSINSRELRDLHWIRIRNEQARSKTPLGAANLTIKAVRFNTMLTHATGGFLVTKRLAV